MRGWLCPINKINVINKKPSVVNNLVLRNMGFDVVIDFGTGSIHPNEPSQGVILNPSKYKLVSTIHNIKNIPSIDNFPDHLTKNPKTIHKYLNEVRRIMFDDKISIKEKEETINQFIKFIDVFYVDDLKRMAHNIYYHANKTIILDFIMTLKHLVRFGGHVAMDADTVVYIKNAIKILESTLFLDINIENMSISEINQSIEEIINIIGSMTTDESYSQMLFSHKSVVSNEPMHYRISFDIYNKIFNSASHSDISTIIVDKIGRFMKQNESEIRKLSKLLDLTSSFANQRTYYDEQLPGYEDPHTSIAREAALDIISGNASEYYDKYEDLFREMET
jgi:hypothetical protein